MATSRTSTASTTPSSADASENPISSAADSAAEKGGELIDRAKMTATSQANSQKQRAASGLDSAADAMREVSTNMRQQQPTLANVTAVAADRTQDIARYLQQTDVNDMVRGVEDFARRQPLLFLGGAFAIGLLGARFLKASGSQAQMQQSTGERGMYATGPGRSTMWRTSSTRGTGSRQSDRLARTGI
jgi:hypothetical protein